MKVTSPRRQRAWYRAAEKSPDPVLALAVLTLAERWATAIEEQIDGGQPLEAAAADAHRAVTGGAGGVQLHAGLGTVMVDFLADCWEHGARLRNWHAAHGTQ